MRGCILRWKNVAGDKIMKIAVCGKGGVGKTTISAFLIRALEKMGRKILAIDSDPSPHLARVLGFPGADQIVPIAEMKDLLQERSEKNGPFYRLNPRVDDLPEKFMRQEGAVKLMVLGAIQEGGAGCACADNAVLRTLLNILLLSPDEDVVIDMEAGVEHLGRGTVASVDHLLVVVQPYRGSIETAARIRKLANDLGINHLNFVANNVEDEEDLRFIEKGLGLKVAGSFSVSGEIRKAERKGLPISDHCPSGLNAALELLTSLEQNKNERAV